MIGTVFAVSMCGWASPPSADVLSRDWAELTTSHWTHRPTFSAKEWGRLADGKGIKRREKLEGADRVLGALWTDAPRDAL